MSSAAAVATRIKTKQSGRVSESRGSIANISEKVVAAREPNWVFTEKSSRRWIVVSGAIVIQACFDARIPSGEAIAGLTEDVHELGL